MGSSLGETGDEDILPHECEKPGRKRRRLKWRRSLQRAAVLGVDTRVGENPAVPGTAPPSAFRGPLRAHQSPLEGTSVRARLSWGSRLSAPRPAPQASLPAPAR